MAKGFAGEIKLDVRDSTPDWNAYLAPKAPDGAPNVLIVLYGGTAVRPRQTLAKAGAVLALNERIDPTEVSMAIDAIVVTDDR
ncbi:MAG TPA: hypothetical protein VGW74_00820 [Propionibacteriaceae bacterium]|nr:hypothetical protein [Propionibacteriaceae bacterium]